MLLQLFKIKKGQVLLKLQPIMYENYELSQTKKYNNFSSKNGFLWIKLILKVLFEFLNFE